MHVEVAEDVANATTFAADPRPRYQGVEARLHVLVRKVLSENVENRHRQLTVGAEKANGCNSEGKLSAC